MVYNFGWSERNRYGQIMNERELNSRFETRQLESFFDSTIPDFEVVPDPPPQYAEATNRYRIGELLGCGGAGSVYRARDEELARDVAIKILRAEYLDKPAVVKRFVEEAKIICGLQHPGIAQIYDFGLCRDGRPFYSMKVVDGATLEQNIRFQPTQMNSEPIHVFAQLCQTIAYAHSQNIVHLDIKPANVMVGAFGEVHVMDWGNAKRLGFRHPEREAVRGYPADRPTDPLHVGGTPNYMRPEQATNQKVTKQFDVFALGATLCHILTGDPPYLGDSRSEVIEQAITGKLNATLPKIENSGFDGNLVRLATECLDQDPEKRPRDANEVADRIASYRKSALQLYESDMARFFELSLDLFCIAGFDGYFRRINSNFTRVLGISESDLLKRPFLEFVHEDDHQETVSQMSVLLEGKPVVRFRNRYRCGNGKYVLFEWTAKSVPEEDVIYAVARLVDRDWELSG